MGRLAGRGLGTRLGKEPSRLMTKRRAEGLEAPRRSQSYYDTGEWRTLRKQILARDGYVCQQTGVALVGRYPAGNSPVVDHITPHRGDRELFFDPSNLQAVAKSWHDSVKQSMERRGLA